MLPYADQLGPGYDCPLGTDSESVERLIAALEAFACMHHPSADIVDCINGMVIDLHQITGRLNKMEETRCHRLADAYAEVHAAVAQADTEILQAFIKG